MYDYLDSIRIRALASIMRPDHEAFIQGVQEWYSEKFHTALHTVQELPLDDVMFVYYRHYYRGLESEERHNEAIWLLETPEERAARKENDEADEDRFIRQAREQNAKKKKNPKLANVEKLLRQMKEKKAKAPVDPEALASNVESLGLPPDRPLTNKPIPETKLPASQPDEEVKVTYMSEADFDKMLDEQPGPTRKPSK